MDWLTSGVDNIWHVWFNSEKDHDSTKYAFKEMLHELQRLPRLFKRQREGSMPKVHQQCSLSAPVAIPDPNKLTCCLGKDVATCPILLDLEAKIAERRKTDLRITDEQVDGVKGATCCWHILKESAMGRNHTFDTSEGYILTEGDRMYWDNVYKNLAGPGA